MRLKILTPGKTVLDIEVKGVFAKAIDGEIGILPGHIPLMTALNIGTTSYLTMENKKEFISVMGGILKVEDDLVTILTETAEHGEDIDETRARQAADRAKAQLEGLLDQNIPKSSPDVEKARMALMKALARMNAADKSRKRF
jgi:F-type H+-transporting ATPase subunit epsilon